jgi:hypothetical protein
MLEQNPVLLPFDEVTALLLKLNVKHANVGCWHMVASCLYFSVFWHASEAWWLAGLKARCSKDAHRSSTAPAEHCSRILEASGCFDIVFEELKGLHMDFELQPLLGLRISTRNAQHVPMVGSHIASLGHCQAANSAMRFEPLRTMLHSKSKDASSEQQDKQTGSNSQLMHVSW